ncbi:hypothetical protein [Actinomadura roseirufa]|uniref:hypothetical protein n=1 Tax=Actinomadura roseirufa TaxID=2094049 RepID=UPI0010419044|nr:hypothetical protein [Actinomadura roseirufa]
MRPAHIEGLLRPASEVGRGVKGSADDGAFAVSGGVDAGGDPADLLTQCEGTGLDLHDDGAGFGVEGVPDHFRDRTQRVLEPTSRPGGADFDRDVIVA